MGTIRIERPQKNRHKGQGTTGCCPQNVVRVESFTKHKKKNTGNHPERSILMAQRETLKQSPSSCYVHDNDESLCVGSRCIDARAYLWSSIIRGSRKIRESRVMELVTPYLLPNNFSLRLDVRFLARLFGQDKPNLTDKK